MQVYDFWLVETRASYEREGFAWGSAYLVEPPASATVLIGHSQGQ